MSYSVTINAQTYSTYADVAFGDQYALERGLGSLPAAWTAGTATTKAQALLMSTRLLDRLDWQGVRVSAPPALAWPRTGVVLPDGSTVDSTTIPGDISRGCVELAMAILVDPDGVADTNQGTSSNIKSVKAGPAAVEFWRPVDGQRLPQACFDFVSRYLNGVMQIPSLVGVGQANVPDGQTSASIFEDGTTFDLTRAL